MVEKLDDVFMLPEVSRGCSDPSWRYRKHHGGMGRSQETMGPKFNLLYLIVITLIDSLCLDLANGT